MKTLLVILTLIIQAGQFVWGQHKERDLRQYVLQQNKVDSLFVFDHSQKDDHDETRLKYLGQIKAKDGQSFKILTSTWIWGKSLRATNRILIFTTKGQYRGNYYVTMINDLPDRIEDNQLVFYNNDNQDCDPSLTSRISFTSGIPKQIFIECKKGQGDLYTFSKE